MNRELREVEGRWQLVFVRSLPHSPQKVWQALTENDHLAAWFPTNIEGEREAGARLRFVFRENEAPPVDGRMLSYDPPSVLEFSWADGEELRFELQPDGDGTLLTFVNTITQLGKAGPGPGRAGTPVSTCSPLTSTAHSRIGHPSGACGLRGNVRPRCLDDRAARVPLAAGAGTRTTEDEGEHE